VTRGRQQQRCGVWQQRRGILQQHFQHLLPRLCSTQRAMVAASGEALKQVIPAVVSGKIKKSTVETEAKQRLGVNSNCDVACGSSVASPLAVALQHLFPRSEQRRQGVVGLSLAVASGKFKQSVA